MSNTTTRRRTPGAGLAGVPMLNIVLLQLAFGVGLILVAVDAGLRWAAIAVLVAAAVLALARWRGRWLTEWTELTVRYLGRPHDRVAEDPGSGTARTPAPVVEVADVAVADPEIGDPAGGPEAPAAPSTTSPDGAGSTDPRVALLRLLIPDLVLAQGTDHERAPVGLAWHEGTWTAVLQVDPAPALVTTTTDTPNLPLAALAPCLEDRGVLLDAIQVIWHCYPGSAALPASSPALESYLEVLGPLPAAARRTTWVAVRLDPRRCPAAVRERGGGIVGSHRALLGALSRVRSALAADQVRSRPLAPDELLRAGISAAELAPVTGSPAPVELRERWDGVTAGDVGHASYAVTGWPADGAVVSLTALTGVRALSATISLTVAPSGADGEVGLRGLLRVSARSRPELVAADERLLLISQRLGVELTPLHGLQVAGLAGTLPLGGGA